MKLTRKQQIVALVIFGLFAFLIPVPKGLLGVVTPISLILFILIMVDLIRDSVKARRGNIHVEKSKNK